METLDQGRWSPTITPLAKDSQGAYLFDVSCPAVDSCVAVGYSFTRTGDNGAGTMLVESLAGGQWSVDPTPSLGSGVRGQLLEQRLIYIPD